MNEQMKQALEEIAEWLDEAEEDVATWGGYASDYFQNKWDLHGESKKYKERAAKVRSLLSQQAAEPTKWTIFHDGKSVTADTLTGSILAAQELRTDEERAIAARNLLAAIDAELAADDDHTEDKLAMVQPAAAAGAEPRFNIWSGDDGDTWFEHPADAEFVHGLKVGDTYELLAGWQSEHATYRVTKAPDDESDDYEVECVSHPSENVATPPAEAQAAPVGAHSVAMKIVHEEAGRTLSRNDFDLCMRIAKRALSQQPAVRVPEDDSTAVAMRKVAEEHAHGLALALECILGDHESRVSSRWYESSLDKLSAYREAMSAIHERESPTFMGEPLLPMKTCRSCKGSGVDGDCGVDGTPICVPCPACNGSGIVAAPAQDGGK